MIDEARPICPTIGDKVVLEVGGGLLAVVCDLIDEDGEPVDEAADVVWVVCEVQGEGGGFVACPVGGLVLERRQ